MIRRASLPEIAPAPGHHSSIRAHGCELARMGVALNYLAIDLDHYTRAPPLGTELFNQSRLLRALDCKSPHCRWLGSLSPAEWSHSSRAG